MPSLREIQHRAYEAITGTGAALQSLIDGTGIPASIRIQVYQNNLRETTRKILAASYPIVQRLVGELCFRNLARLYSTRFPSRSGDLGEFGGEFPRFLADLYEQTSYEYLSSVAELEWACAQSEVAADAEPLDARALMDIDEAALADLRFALHPSLRIVRSRHCAFTIWSAHENDDFAGIDLRAPAENVLVYRHGTRLVVRPIDAAGVVFTRSLQAGASLVDAYQEAAEIIAGFDPAAALRDLYGAGLLIGLRRHHQEHPSNGGHSRDNDETH
ncbi:MAG TPA: DNA-binding domain-containing protein [Gammaproteobacteria bacterium]|nr:DNA-binding domain-containing protein [Gammaproteobacteria bacterium]